ncbi:hypothetical protein CLF_110528 [Clonorchis sinensis]|uniref:polynucleotide adenylyltransferase n=2 Tax=Clonorchis sinensis TaxID=79923 RepID=G7YTL6_CLOSI|nr:hypothetical protein CLF_110528 [Clonorchis sinensis]
MDHYQDRQLVRNNDETVSLRLTSKHDSVTHYLTKSNKLSHQPPTLPGYNTVNISSTTTLEQNGLIKREKARARKRKAYLTFPKCRRPVNIVSRSKPGTHDSSAPPSNRNHNPTLLEQTRTTLHTASELQPERGTRSYTVLSRRVLSQIPSDKNQPSNRYHVFSFKQVKHLDEVLQTVLTVSPRPVTWDFMVYHPSSIHTETCPRQLLATTDDSCATRSSNAVSGNSSCTCDHIYCESLPRRAFREVITKCGHHPRSGLVSCMPLLYIPLVQLIRTIRDRLTDEQIVVREVRLNGGAAGCVIEDSDADSYNDLDLIFSVDLSNTNTFAKIKSIVFSSISQFLANTFASGKVAYSCTHNTCFHLPNVSQRCGCTKCTRDMTFSEFAPDRKLTQAKNGVISNHHSTSTSIVLKTEQVPKKYKNDQILTDLTDKKELPSKLANLGVDDQSISNGIQKSSDQESTNELHQTKNTQKDMSYSCTCSPCLPTSTVNCPGWDSLLRDESYAKHYIQKMVRIHKQSSKTADSWSLFTLGFRTPEGGKTIDIKFVDRMHRQFEFTVDSFQIVLDSLLTFHETSRQPLTENFYPTVVAESVSGSFTEAVGHLRNRLIVTARPEEIRGGGLLKYCKLLVDGYRPPEDTDVLSMERYMCSRFFIDFPDIISQHHRLAYYLANHFEDNDALKSTYLQILHEVVSHSTICLMTHERQQTLCLIRMFLQDELTREEASQSVVHLEEFSSDKWALDSIYYGTNFFPKQLLILSSSSATTVYQECAICKNQSNATECREQNQSPLGCAYLTCDNYFTAENTPESYPAAKHVAKTESDEFFQNHEPHSADHEDYVDSNGDTTHHTKKSAKLSTATLKLPTKQRLSDVEELTDAETETSSTSLRSYLSQEVLKTNGTKDCQPALELLEQGPNADGIKLDSVSPSLDPAVSTVLNDALATYPQKIYYIPQIVTYFPATDFPRDPQPTVKAPDLNEETAYNHAQNLNESFNSVDDEASLPRFLPHCHAGIIFPSTEQVSSSELNHYVGIPCSSDVQFNYLNHAMKNAFLAPNSPLSLYVFDQDPSYCLYTSPVMPSEPSPFILAYPI